MKTYYLSIILLPLALFLGGCSKSESTTVVEEDLHSEITGQEIIFVRDGQINLFNPASQESSILTSDQEGNNYAPAWLPNGQEIIYLSTSDQYTKFFKLDLTNLQSTFLGATKSQPSYFSISPSGDKLLYLENQNLFLLDLLTSQTKKIDEQVSYPTWSPYGKQIAFISQTEYLKIYTLANQDLTEISQGSFISPQFYNNQILFFAQKEEESYNLIKLNLNSSTEAENYLSLDLSALEQGQLNFSSDHKNLLFSSAQVNYLIDLQDKSLTELPVNGFDWVWVAGTDKLYYHLLEAEGEDLIRNLYQVNYQGKQKKLILNNVGSAVSSVQFNSQTLNY